MPGGSDSSKRCAEGVQGSRLSTPARTGSACWCRPARAAVQLGARAKQGRLGHAAAGLWAAEPAHQRLGRAGDLVLKLSWQRWSKRLGWHFRLQFRS